MGAIRIGVQQEGSWLGFDLAEVMAAVGDASHLRRLLRNAEFNGDVTPVWPEGIAIEARTDAPGGLATSWEEMSRLGESFRQTVDGAFIGYRSDGSPEVMLAVIDSSFWVVWAEKEVVLDQMRSAFVGVDDYDEPRPPPRT